MLEQQGCYIESPRPEVAAFIPPEASSALDVGCGVGGFGTSLRKHLGASARIVGIDAVSSNVEAARRGHGFDEVLEGYYPDVLTGTDENFDLIVFNDVLEHVLDPWEMLRGAKRHVAPGGSVLAAIPSIQYLPVVYRLVRGRWDYTDVGTLDRTHVRFFTKATAREMFEQAGYSVDICEGANSFTTEHPRWWPLAKLVGDMQYLHVVIRARPLETR